MTIEQFHDLMSQENKPQATALGCELDHNLAKTDTNSDDNDITVDKSHGSSTQSEYEVKSTDVSILLIDIKENVYTTYFAWQI